MVRCLDMKEVNVIELSKYIIKYLGDKRIPVNHLKLQKLIYYVDAWHYVFKNYSLITDNFEAWQHGPVIRKVWDYYKKSSILYDNLSVPKNVDFKVSKEQLQIINDVLDEYGDKTGYYLECLTHEEEPWKKARMRENKLIEKNHMKQFYSNLLECGNGPQQC